MWNSSRRILQNSVHLASSPHSSVLIVCTTILDFFSCVKKNRRMLMGGVLSGVQKIQVFLVLGSTISSIVVKPHIDMTLGNVKSICRSWPG